MPSEILAVHKMDRGDRNLIVALRSGEIRMYSGKNLIDKLQLDEICQGNKDVEGLILLRTIIHILFIIILRKG